MNLHFIKTEDQFIALGVIINMSGCIGITFFLLWYTIHIGIGGEHVSK